MSRKITIYTDGAASGNPGPGGYGIVLISGHHRKEISGGFRFTTNNRMELLAVIIALETLKLPGSDVTVYTDSRYVADAVEKGWLFDWERKRFRKKKNTDLWIRFLKTFRRHTVKFVWIKGHADHPENEKCDRMAVLASRSGHLPDDEGFRPEEDSFFSDPGE